MSGDAVDSQLNGLTPAQRAAVTADAAVVCVVAGAGSGKTTVLTRRIAWRACNGTADPDHVLVATFTRKAAGELRRRLARLGVEGVWAGTFHAAAYAQLRQHWADTSASAPSVIPDGRRILRDVVAAEPGLGDGLVERLAGEAAWASARLVEPESYPAAAQAVGRAPGMALEQVARVLGRYRQEKRSRRVLDLDDLVGECARMLDHGGPSAAAVRWRFRHLFVDEFQDVNAAQWNLLMRWTGDRPDLCVVGDPRQAVYGWNGSDPSLIARLPSLLPGTVVVHLDENRRSSPQILAAAGAVLDLAGDLGSSPATTVPTTAPDGPPALVTGFDDEEAEAAAVVRWLRATRAPGGPWHRCAVLARTNARLEPVAEALRQAGIPTRRASRGDPERSTTAAIRLLREFDRHAPLHAALVDVGAEDGDDVVDLLRRLVAEYVADGFAGDGAVPTVGGFLSWVSATGTAKELELRADGVELATFHRAKGLEWNAVALIGLEDGTVPIVHAATADARAEERRLFYVALTRAERQLWCSWSARTGEPDRARRRAPSPFLGAVRTAASAAEPTSADVAPGMIAALRGRLVATS